MQGRRMKNRGPVQKPKNLKGTVLRLYGYLKPYRFRLVLVVIGVMLTSLASVAGTAFLRPIFNNYIVPLIGQKSPDLSGFIRLLFLLACVYAVGILSNYLYNRQMVNITANVLDRIRTDLFRHMETLPIRYFDTHTNGDLMSRYTNDIDSLREMVSRGIPQLVSSFITVTGVFLVMLIMSPLLTVMILGMLGIMILIVRVIGGKSRKFFMERQKQIGSVNGFIEEMITGQKVVKVFCHEEKSVADFDALNAKLREADTNANIFANILMPIIGNLSHMNYALTAAAGGALVITGLLDIGTIASFLQYSRTFTQPITQSTQQINSILLALAGAERIFEMMDEDPEVDEGYVTLVHASYDENGSIRESGT